MQPIDYQGTETLSFLQIDSLNGLAKGTAFRLFKRCESALVEGRDYFYLPESAHAAFIQTLKDQGSIYQTTRHLVLLTRAGYQRMQGMSGRGEVGSIANTQP